ncbi:HeH/LEM domain-containing protein [Carnobacterium divergens]
MPPENRQAELDYSSMTVPQLKEVLSSRGIDYSKDSKKQDLLKMLEE